MIHIFYITVVYNILIHYKHCTEEFRGVKEYSLFEPNNRFLKTVQRIWEVTTVRFWDLSKNSNIHWVDVKERYDTYSRTIWQVSNVLLFIQSLYNISTFPIIGPPGVFQVSDSSCLPRFETVWTIPTTSSYYFHVLRVLRRLGSVVRTWRVESKRNHAHIE